MISVEGLKEEENSSSRLPRGRDVESLHGETQGVAHIRSRYIVGKKGRISAGSRTEENFRTRAGSDGAPHMGRQE